MMKIRYLLLLLAVAMLLSCSAMNSATGSPKALSPYDYGLATAKTGVERYNVLLKTHKAAVAAGADVDYTGIKSIDIEIPDKFTPIPLTQNNDFKGCTITVRNKIKGVWLFTTSQKGQSIAVGKREIDKGDFRAIPELTRGKYILVIEDENPWVLNRSGYSYGHVRKDILHIKNGRATNSVTMPYNNEYSSPKCTYVTMNNAPLMIKNLTFNRTEDCTQITKLLSMTMCSWSGYRLIRQITS